MQLVLADGLVRSKQENITMGDNQKTEVLTNGISFKAAIERRWKRQLEETGNQQYREVIEEELAEEAIDETDSKPSGCAHCREQGRHLLHSKHVLRLNVALCVIDCIMVMVELLLDNAAVRNDIVNRYGTAGENCIQATDNSTIRHKRSASSDSGDEYGSHSTYATIAHYCHYVSVAILVLLTVETLFKLFFLGKRFFHSKLEVFDAFIVIASLIADSILLEGVTSKPPLESIAIVNMLLPWRVIRVVNSLIIATREHEHFKLLLVYRAKKLTVDDLFIAKRQLDLARDKNKTLTIACRKAGLDVCDNSILMAVESKILLIDGVAVTSKNEKEKLTGDDVSLRIEDDVSQINSISRGENCSEPVTRVDEDTNSNPHIVTHL